MTATRRRRPTAVVLAIVLAAAAAAACAEDQNGSRPDGSSSAPSSTTVTAAAPPPTTTTTATDAAPVGPPIGATWQYQLTGSIDVAAPAEVFDVDGADTGADQVADLHARGRYVICYLSAGTLEGWRSDGADLADSVVGRPLVDWPDERWLDVRRIDELLRLLRRRVAACAAKGFDAVELDNVDGFRNETGFPITAADQLAFNRAAAAAVRDAGLAVGLKNDAEQVSDLVDDFDFAIVEQCVRRDECDRYVPFVEAGKPVFLVEYDLEPTVVCAEARRLGFSAIVKELDLTADLWTC